VPKMSLHQKLVKHENGSYESFETLTFDKHALILVALVDYMGMKWLDLCPCNSILHKASCTFLSVR
jgi:hypothetical protein